MTAPGDAEWGLLRGIEADFESDVPRLVYADWLEERGTEGDGARARFIRWQCERARLGEDVPARKFAEFGRAVFGGVPGNLPREPLVRGFPAPCEWKTFTFNRGVAAFRAAAPLPPALRLTGRDDAEYERVFALADLGVVRSLALDVVTVRMARAFAASPHLAGLEHFEFRAHHHGRSSDAATLEDSAPYGRLAGLTVTSANWFSPGQLARHLWSAPGLRSLAFRERSPRSYDPTPAGDGWFAALAGALRNLRSLELEWCLNAPVPALAQAVGLVALEHLAVVNHAFADADVAVLLAIPHLQTVRRLDLSWARERGRPKNRRLTDAGARLILNDPRPWESIDLAGSAVSPLVLAEVAERCGA